MLGPHEESFERRFVKFDEFMPQLHGVRVHGGNEAALKTEAAHIKLHLCPVLRMGAPHAVAAHGRYPFMSEALAFPQSWELDGRRSNTEPVEQDAVTVTKHPAAEERYLALIACQRVQSFKDKACPAKPTSRALLDQMSPLEDSAGARWEYYCGCA